MILHNLNHPEQSDYVKELYYEKHGKELDSERPVMLFENQIAVLVCNFSISESNNMSDPSNIAGVISGCKYYGITDHTEVEIIQKKIKEIMKIEKDYNEGRNRKIKKKGIPKKVK